MPRISLIIPQHGESRLTSVAVASFLDHHLAFLAEGSELLIVDDGSRRTERRRLQQLLPRGVGILPLVRRRGVTAAWEAGRRFSQGETLVFLNNDTISLGAWINELIAPLESKTVLMSGVGWRVERELSCRPQVLDGWCFAIRRETLRLVGGFDDVLRLYFSDTDLQLRLIQRVGGISGLSVVDGLPLRHLGHQSTRHLLTRRVEWRTDRKRFLGKWSRTEFPR